ncbi:MAG: DUF4349 domain-containing protein [bacterium]
MKKLRPFTFVVLVFVLGLIAVIVLGPKLFIGSGFGKISGQLNNVENSKYTSNIIGAPVRGKLFAGIIDKNVAVSDYAGNLSLEEESPVSFDRKIIKTGAISLEVISIEKAMAAVKEATNKAGGFIGSSSVEEQPQDAKYGSIVVRIPQTAFDGALSTLKKIGRVTKENVAGEDVTEEYVDIESRLRNLKREEARFLDVLDMAKSVKDILAVEEQLGRVRGEIETSEGRQKYLDNRIALATITIDMYEKASVASATPKLWGIADTLKKALRAFLETFRTILFALIWIAVFSPLIILIYLLSIISRRYRAKKAKKQ